MFGLRFSAAFRETKEVTKTLLYIVHKGVCTKQGKVIILCYVVSIHVGQTNACDSRLKYIWATIHKK